MKLCRSSFYLFRPQIRSWSMRRKLRNPFAGLGFGRTNMGGWHFSRHWPHLLCWSWSISITPYRGAKYDGPRRWHTSGLRHNVGKSCWITTPVGTLRLSWQHYDWMVARRAQDDARRFLERRMSL